MKCKIKHITDIIKDAMQDNTRIVTLYSYPHMYIAVLRTNRRAHVALWLLHPDFTPASPASPLLAILRLLLRVCTLQDIIDDRFGKTVEQRSPADIEGTLISMFWPLRPFIVPMICLARLWAITRATATSTTLALAIVTGGQLSTHFTWQPRHCTRHV